VSAANPTGIPTPLPSPELPAGRARLVVTGFMGTGKTTVGREAARLLGMPFVDLDEVIERRSAASVTETFATHGQEAFRALERDAVADAARLSGAVVATGGGAPVDRASFAALADGSTVAVLRCEPGELLVRLGDAASRPLLAPDPAGRIRDLLAERDDAYRAAGDPLDTTGRSSEEVAAEAAERHRAGAGRPADVRVAVETASRRYHVLIGDGTADRVAEAIPSGAGLAAVVCDGAVLASTGDRVAKSLKDAGVQVETIALPPGEAAKTLDIVAGVWDRFREAGLTRGDVVVAVGGGAALDAAGFGAATFARGVALVNVPTTLLAMVDASVGGKTGIDHGAVKNLVGAFHQPTAVIADPTTLDGLPVPDLRCGLAEAVKSFVLASPLALDVLESVPLDRDGVPTHLEWVIEQAVRVKAAFVSLDEEDRGPRHALNLGHTFAHGIESASGFRVPHGEAVAVGMIAAARLGAAAGVTDPGLAGRLVALVGRFGLPTQVPAGLDRDGIMEGMASDKKRRAGRAVFVVPAPGGAALLDGVDPTEAIAALEARR